MEISLPMILLVGLLVGLGGFVDASAGGGGLITLPAYMLTGLPVHVIYAANKFSSACGTTFSSAMFLGKKAFDGKAALAAAAASFLGSALAAHLVLILPDRVLKTLVLVMLPLAAVIIFARRNLPEEDRSREVPRKKALLLLAGTVPFALAIPCALCNICGALLGSHFALSRGAKFIRPMMLVVMGLLLIKMATDLFL